MLTKKIKYLLVLIIIAFGGITLWAGSFDMPDDPTLTGAGKRDASLAVELQYAQEKVGSGYLQSEINFVTYDKTEKKLVSIGNLTEVAGKQNFAINVGSYSENELYFFVYRVDSSNKVHVLFPNEESSNPVAQNESLKVGDELAFGEKAGVEKFYFFVSKTKLFSKTPTKSELDKAVAKYNQGYVAILKEEKEINNQKINPNYIWFKNSFGAKVVVVNKGKSKSVSSSIKNSANSEVFKGSKVKLIR